MQEVSWFPKVIDYKNVIINNDISKYSSILPNCKMSLLISIQFGLNLVKNQKFYQFLTKNDF